MPTASLEKHSEPEQLTSCFAKSQQQSKLNQRLLGNHVKEKEELEKTRVGGLKTQRLLSELEMEQAEQLAGKTKRMAQSPALQQVQVDNSESKCNLSGEVVDSKSGAKQDADKHLELAVLGALTTHIKPFAFRHSITSYRPP